MARPLLGALRRRLALKPTLRDEAVGSAFSNSSNTPPGSRRQTEISLTGFLSLLSSWNTHLFWSTYFLSLLYEWWSSVGFQSKLLNRHFCPLCRMNGRFPSVVLFCSFSLSLSLSSDIFISDESEEWQERAGSRSFITPSYGSVTLSIYYSYYL